MRGITPRTQKTYLREVRNLALYFKKSPEELGESEIKEYLLHLLKERKEKWIEARAEDLLPIQYFHVVFTIPAELNPLVLRNQKVMYNLLFRSVSETLLKLSNDPKHLGARIGFIGILHTWGQNLRDHPHIHCIVTLGGLNPDKSRWVSCRKNFFIHIKVLSSLFRGKFLDYLKDSFKSGDLIFPGVIGHLKEPDAFEGFRRQFK